MLLPDGARRLFRHYPESALATPAGQRLVALRLAEEGDRDDLRWLVASAGENTLSDAIAAHGDRQLSRRSLAFWRRVLDLPAAARQDEAAEVAAELWPR